MGFSRSYRVSRWFDTDLRHPGLHIIRETGRAIACYGS